jgi:hypothetical protein
MAENLYLYEEEADFGADKLLAGSPALSLHDVMCSEYIADKYKALTGLVESLSPTEFKLVVTMARLIASDEFQFHKSDTENMTPVARALYGENKLEGMKDPAGAIRAHSNRIFDKLSPKVQKNYQKISHFKGGLETNLRVIGHWCLNLSRNIAFDDKRIGLDLTISANRAVEYRDTEIAQDMDRLKKGEIIMSEEDREAVKEL